ncbi:hypothetical protein A1F99_104650 [Pyrenophora tritici-repentis]|nr:hypothetical protein A1F99_104650 [Pyrenophora tritici-repentis]
MIGLCAYLLAALGHEYELNWVGCVMLSMGDFRSERELSIITVDVGTY